MINWTKERLKKTITDALGEDTLLVMASNREPYVHVVKEGKVDWERPAGGVATALDPVMQACGGLWVAHGRGSGDKKVVDKDDCIKVPPNNPSYTLKRIWLSKEEERGYYYGFSNRSLWPLCHLSYTRPSFDESDWHYYKLINRRFADVILDQIAGKKAVVWIHDFHLALLAQMIKQRRPDVLCIHF
jgi:trehalose 6-phosphate synthase